jgi:hypothetical protein
LLEELHVRPASSKQEEVVWNGLTAGYAKELNRFGSFVLYALPDAPPPVERPYRVATLGMPGYGRGIYLVEHLDTVEYLPDHLKRFRPPDDSIPVKDAEAAAKILSLDAVFVGAGETFEEGVGAAIRREFGPALRMPDRFTLYLRRHRLRRED